MTPTIEPYEGPEGRDGALVRTDYHEGFIAELKTLPVPDRRWDYDGSGAWWVAASHEDLVGHYLIRYFGGFGKVDPDTGETDYVDASGEVTRQGGLFG